VFYQACARIPAAPALRVHNDCRLSMQMPRLGNVAPLARRLLSSSGMTEAYFNLADDSTDQLDGPLSDRWNGVEPDHLAVTGRPSQKPAFLTTRIDRLRRWLARRFL
jgi:hypothetical protein